MSMSCRTTCHQLSGPMAARERRNLRSSSTFIPIARTCSFGIAVSAARECTSRSANRAASGRKQRPVSELHVDAHGSSRAGRSHSQVRPQTKPLLHSHRPRLTPRSHSSTAVAAGRVELAARHSTPTRVRSDPGQRWPGDEVSAAAHSRRSRAACAEGICWRLQQTRERVRKTHRVPPASGSCLGKQATASTETEKESNMGRLAHRTMAERTRQTSVATSERRRRAPTLRTAAATTETPAPQNTQPAVNTNSQTMQPAAAAV